MKGQVYDKCASTVTPAANNPVCNQLFEWAEKSKSWSKKILNNKQMRQDTSLKVFYWNEKFNKATNTTCYRSCNLNLYFIPSSVPLTLSLG